ncbi:HNH endonuclease [Shewanella algae]
MIWVVYVSDKPHSRVNFPIGMDAGIWGVHESKKRTVKDVQVDDLVAFVYSISWLKAEGAPPAGFSRVGKDKLKDFRGIVQKIIIGQVTQSYYRSEEQVWPDDIYPHRFKFSIKERMDDVFFGTEFYNEDFVEAVRYSACTQGSVTRASTISKIEQISVDEDEGEPLSEFEVKEPSAGYEGRPILKLHLSRERDSKLVKAKKNQVLAETGKLACEVCQMDFYKTYGELGKGFAECHHNRPLALRSANQETTLDELTILCANCHRMLHRRKHWLTVAELKGLYVEHKY